MRAHIHRGVIRPGSFGKVNTLKPGVVLVCTMMKALCVTPDNVDKLNAELKEGWMVSNMCSMPSSVSTGTSDSIGRSTVPMCLVILYKNEQMPRTEV